MSDGDVDVVTRDIAKGVFILENDGAGSFIRHVVATNPREDLALLNPDGNGDLDILIERSRLDVVGSVVGRIGKVGKAIDSALRLPALTADDLENLDFAVANAEIIGQSFVRRPEDVLALHAELIRRGGGAGGLILKIETREAFEALPRILLAAMRCPPTGVMVARGDLAVELGHGRLAEVQEEMLRLCEAAHMPVIWATQVLETLAKKGQASRAEVTDAAMSGRAECVMLNKGPYIVETVRFLDDVLYRMKLHQDKKSAMLRKLSISSLTGRFHPQAEG